MRELILFILLISVVSVKSQNLTDRKINKLSKLNIEINSLDFTNLAVQKDLNRILKLERKRKTNKTVGIILSSIAITEIILGSYLISIGSNVKDDGHDFVTPIGMIMIGGGVICGGVSIPFWVSSKKRKKERDRLIKIYDKQPLE